jgi:hypothetical protein
MEEKIVDFNNKKAQKDELLEMLDKENGSEKIEISKDALNFLNNKMSTLQQTVENQNTKIDVQSTKMDAVIEVAANLINELKKQTIDETRPACKISRDTEREDAIPVKSLNRHLDFYIFTGHIAEIFEIYTKDKKKFSIQNASKMLSELKIRNDINFSDLNPSGKNSKVRTYSYDVFEEIIDRFKNPNKYNLDIETTSKWITKCKLPSQAQIDEYRNNIKKEL